MKKNKFAVIAWISFYILIFFILLNNSFSYLDPDLGWHLRVGEQILKERSVPTFDHYDYTLSGQKWVDHEWLFNLIIYLIYTKLGYLALNIVFALLIIFILILLYQFTKKNFLTNKFSPFFIMFLQLFGVLAMLPHLGVRLQEIALLFILLLLIILHKFNTQKKWPVLLWLTPLFYCWANLHGSFLIGIFILFLFLVIKIIEAIIIKYKNKYKFFDFIDFNYTFNVHDFKLFLFFSGLSLTTTLFTPYGINLYSFLSGYANNFYMKHISEWLPAYYIPIQYKQLFYIAIIIVFVAYPLLFVKKTKINLWYLALTFVFILLPFKSKRHFPLLFVVSFPLLIQNSSEFLYSPQSFSKKYINNLFSKIYIILAFFLAILALGVSTNYTNNPFKSKINCQDYPCQAVKFFKEHPEYIEPNILNSYGWGGFLIHELPKKKLFIDGRLPQYKFAGHTLLEEYFDFFEEGKTEELINKYNIKVVLLKKLNNIKLGWFEKYLFHVNENEIKNKENFLVNYLEDSPDWRLVFHKNNSYVYSK